VNAKSTRESLARQASYSKEFPEPYEQFRFVISQHLVLPEPPYAPAGAAQSAVHRILGVNDGQVRFAYTKPGSSRRRTMVLAAPEFIRRFLQHVPPTGFMKVRHYGFLSPSFGVPFEEARSRVQMAHGFAAKPVNTEIDGGQGRTRIPPVNQRGCWVSADSTSRVTPKVTPAESFDHRVPLLSPTHAQ